MLYIDGECSISKISYSLYILTRNTNAIAGHLRNIEEVLEEWDS